jgi:hypothetical protein
MSLVEVYLFLLADSFISGLVLPAKNDLVFTTMRIFGNYNMPFAAFISTIGLTLAAFINWGLGRMLRSLKKTSAEKTPLHPLAEKSFTIVRKYGYFAAIFGFVPFLGPVITVLLGGLRVNLPKIILIIFMVNLLWRGFLIN